MRKTKIEKIAVKGAGVMLSFVLAGAIAAPAVVCRVNVNEDAAVAAAERKEKKSRKTKNTIKAGWGHQYAKASKSKKKAKTMPKTWGHQQKSK